MDDDGKFKTSLRYTGRWSRPDLSKGFDIRVDERNNKRFLIRYYDNEEKESFILFKIDKVI
ncbi:MAG: hypothetical protein ACREBJ_12255 [Nitrosotalea sp.]